jgi:hypothetical protein
MSVYCRKSRGSGAGPITQVALVVLLVLSGGLSLMQLSSRSQVRDLKIHHEALQEELTYTKNHLHHVEVGAVRTDQSNQRRGPCVTALSQPMHAPADCIQLGVTGGVHRCAELSVFLCRPSWQTKRQSTHTWHRRFTSTLRTTQFRSWKLCARRYAYAIEFDLVW